MTRGLDERHLLAEAGVPVVAIQEVLAPAGILLRNDAPVRRFVAWAESHIAAENLRGMRRDLQDFLDWERRGGAVAQP